MFRFPILFKKSTFLLRTFKYQFVQSNTQEPIKSDSTITTTKEEIPIHLKPYDKAKYEVPSTKLKMGSGYSLLDLEPMPRGKIMKICYIILEKLKEVPEKSLYRIYTEEKIKYVMKLTDEIEDIRKLEEELGHDTIEIYIQQLNKELVLLDHMKHEKPWESRPEDMGLNNFLKKKRSEIKHIRYDKPIREPAKFIESK